MAEHERSITSGESDPADETLRLYLLCRLDEAERLKLDQRLLIDEELADRMLLAESELTDDYLAEELDQRERESFEQKFLTTESRRQMLRVSTALHDYSEPPSSRAVSLPNAEARPSWREGIPALFGFGRLRVWAISFAVLIMVAGLAWFLTKQRSEIQPIIARNEPVSNPSPQASPQPIASPPVTAPSPPPRKAETIPSPAEPATPPTIATFVLLPGAVRSGGNMLRVAVPHGERDVVRLNLTLDTSAEGVYEAELTRVEGQSVAVRRKLRAVSRGGEVNLTVDIAARLLQSGDYQIKLTHQKADGQSEAAGRYYFRALQ